MAKIERFDIWQAAVKFEDEDVSKNRPVLIWNNAAYVIAYKMTGTNRGDDADEYQVRYWREAGLTKPTSIRIRKQLKLEKADLLYKIGTLDRRDRVRFEFRVLS